MSIRGASDILDEMPKQTNNSFYGIKEELGNELCQPYSLHHWGKGLHIPMLLADGFLQSQQFELAPSVCHFVFDPVAPGRKLDLSRIWRCLPFKDIQRMPLEDYLLETISSKRDPLSNAIVEIEQAFPFNNQLTIREDVQPSSGGEAATPGLPSIFGFATAFYFSIPDNPNIRRLRDTVDDPLFKIRNSQDINGVQKSRPLFDPPPDSALLVQAKAESINLSSVLRSFNGSMPNCWFQYLLGRATHMAVEAKSFGNALLTANEKFDGGAMAALRAEHKASVYQIGIELKKNTPREARAALEALEESRKAPAYRLQYYLKTLGVDQAIPGIEDRFQEVSFNMLGPVGEGNLKLLQDEKTKMDKLSEAHDLQKHIGRLETAASAFHALSLVSTHATSLGCGVALHIGPARVTRLLFSDIYNQAYDLASKAVKAFKYEPPRDGTTYLQT